MIPGARNDSYAVMCDPKSHLKKEEGKETVDYLHNEILVSSRKSCLLLLEWTVGQQNWGYLIKEGRRLEVMDWMSHKESLLHFTTEGYAVKLYVQQIVNYYLNHLYK